MTALKPPKGWRIAKVGEVVPPEYKFLYTNVWCNGDGTIVGRLVVGSDVGFIAVRATPHKYANLVARLKTMHFYFSRPDDRKTILEAANAITRLEKQINRK